MSQDFEAPTVVQSVDPVVNPVEVVPESEASADDFDLPLEKARPRLWLALVRKVDGSEQLVEREKIAELRRDLCAPDIQEVKSVYRAIRKDFSIETHTVRKLTV